MTEFRTFDSFDDMIQSMSDATDAANASLAPEQAALTFGSTWARFDYLVTDGFVVVGKVHTLDEIVKGEAESYASDAEAQEDGYASAADAAEQVRANVVANHDRGYLFGRAYSYTLPDGELGDTHRANAWPISEALFEAMVEGFSDTDSRIRGYVVPHTKRLNERLPEGGFLGSELGQAFSAWREHELNKARAAGLVASEPVTGDTE